ncbi:MAG: hypothetical protein ACTSV7_04350 [Candidatus Baldrarchaeia archaeon]
MKKYNTTKAITYPETGINLIRARKLKEIVSPHISRQHIGQEIFICDKKNVFGVVILNQPTSLTESQFKNHSSRHFITEELKDTVWPNVKKFNAYTFRIKKVFKKPLEFRYKGQEDLEMGELIHNVEIIDREKEALETKVNKYKARLETLKDLPCSVEDLNQKNLLTELFELYLTKLSQKSQHGTGGSSKPRCPSGMRYDSALGRCVRKKESKKKSEEKANV